MKGNKDFDIQLFAEEDGNSSLPETEETPASETEPDVKEEREEKEEGEEKIIPYSRFKEVNDRRKEAEEEKTRLEQELAYYRSLTTSPPTEKKEEAEEEFDWEHPNKAINDIVEKALQREVPRMTAYEMQRKSSANEALKLFPDLADEKSEFFQKTASYLVTSGLDRHPDGVKIAASVVAMTQMPEVMTKSEQARKARLGFVEGGKSKERTTETLTLSPNQENMLIKLGLDKKGKEQVVQRFMAKEAGGER